MSEPFLDVPVYRLACKKYDRQQNDYINKVLRDANAQGNANFRDHLWARYGGCWLFNEIIGYIRLHFLGSQVRGEYFATKSKRIVRTRRKQFEYVTHKLAGEVDIESPVTDATIEAAVRQYLQDCQREVPQRYIDLSVFEVLANHIRWYALWAAKNQFGPPEPRETDVEPAAKSRWNR